MSGDYYRQSTDRWAGCKVFLCIKVKTSITVALSEGGETEIKGESSGNNLMTVTASL